MNRCLSVLAILTIVAAAMPQSTVARGTDRTRVGTLNCDIFAGMGVIIASKKTVTCMFTPAQPGPREVYVGSITKFGLDIGATAGGKMIWGVYASSNRRFSALAGHYVGASAEATVGGGVGANVLVGGSNRTVSLQPVSVQGQAGTQLRCRRFRT